MLAGLSEDVVAIIPNGDEPASEGYQTLDELAEEGNRLYPEPLFDESFLDKDEAKTKVAVSIILSGEFSRRLSCLLPVVLQLLFWNHWKV